VKQGIYCLNVVHNGKKVLSGNGAKADNVMLWDLEASLAGGATATTPLMTFKGHDAPIYSVCAEKCQNEKFFVAGAKNGRLTYYDMEKAEAVLNTEGLHEGVVYSCDFNEDCTTVCTASSDGTVGIWDLRSGKSFKKLSYIDDAAASGVVFQALWRGEYEIMTCGDDYCVKKWDFRKMKNGAIENYLGHTSAVRSIALSHDNKHLASATTDGSLRVWVVDERVNIEAEMDTVSSKIEEIEKRRTILDEKLLDFENEEEIDEDKLAKDCSDLSKQYRKHTYLRHVHTERDNMQCVQARMSLDGHALPVMAIAWRDNPGDHTKAQVLSGSQDQTAMSFNLTKPKTQEFVKWQKDITDESGLPTAGGYGS